MSNKNSSTEEKSMNVSDISTIKDILFGQDIQSIEERFNEINEKIGDVEGDIGNNIDALRKQTDEHLKVLDKRVEDKMAELEMQMKQHVKELEKQIRNVSKSDKQSLAEMLQQLSVSLIKGEK